MDEVTIYTDGACSGNPGPGGWAAILKTKRRGCRNAASFFFSADNGNSDRKKIIAIAYNKLTSL